LLVPWGLLAGCSQPAQARPTELPVRVAGPGVSDTACGEGRALALERELLRASRARRDALARTLGGPAGPSAPDGPEAAEPPRAAPSAGDPRAQAAEVCSRADPRASTRRRLSDERLQIEREIVVLEQAALAAERERAAQAALAEREAAGAVVARDQALLLARLGLTPRQRSLSVTPELERAAEDMIARAALLQLVLATLGGEDAGGAESALGAKLDRARALTPRSPDEALNLADQSRYGFLQLLGRRLAERAAVEASGAGSADDRGRERAALAEALAQSGARSVLDERGVGAVLPAAFAGARLTPAAQRGLEHLCSLARSYPRGPVQVGAGLLARPGGVARAPTPARAPRVAARDAHLAAALSRAGCAGPRFVIAPADPPPSGAEPRAPLPEGDLELTWLAY
jgi:hypothetical protein